MAERPAPLVLVATPPGDVEPGFGTYAAVAAAGRHLLAAELSRRLARQGAAVAPLPGVTPGDGPFHWGRWFADGARRALDAARADDRALDAIGYAGAGALALLDDAGLDDLLSPLAGEAAANNRFSADAFVVAGSAERPLATALDALAGAAHDNAAGRVLDAAGFAVRDLGTARFARFDVDTPLDLALLRLAGRLGLRTLEPALGRFLEMARLPGDRPLLVPELDRIGAVLRDREAELVVAGRVPSDAWAHLETETACRVRLLVEERGMRSAVAAGGRPPRSLLVALLRRGSPSELVAELGGLGDAVILDSRVLMAALAGSADASAWPPPEERYAADLGDASRIRTPWLRELVEAAAAAPVPFLLGGHALVSDGLRIVVAAAWHGR